MPHNKISAETPLARVHAILGFQIVFTNSTVRAIEASFPRCAQGTRFDQFWQTLSLKSTSEEPPIITWR